MAGLLVLSITWLNAISLIPNALGQAPNGCVTYDSNSKKIELACGSTSLSGLDSALQNSNVLKKDSDDTWTLNADLAVDKNAKLAITADDTKWLRIVSPHGISIVGDVIIDSVKITSWDGANSNYALTDGDVPRSFIAYREGGTGTLSITNSEIAYLGYDKPHVQGISYYAGSGSTILNNDIHDMWYGIYSSGTSALQIENNQIHNNIRGAISLQSGSADAIVRGNLISNTIRGSGIACQIDCKSILIESNFVYNSNAGGILLGNAVTATIRNNTISNNVNTVGGISIDASSNNQIFDNKLTSGRYGISLSGASNSNEIDENIILDNNDYGICLTEQSSSNLIHDNEISDSVNYGICENGGASNNKLYSNSISSVGLYGIYLKDPNTKGTLVYDNEIDDSRQDAVRIFNNTDSTFSNNTITETTKYDYSLSNGRVTLYNSTFSLSHFESITNRPDVKNYVRIVNWDDHLVISDKKIRNIIQNGTLILDFNLTNAEPVSLSTTPFAVYPEDSRDSLDISFIDGSIDSNFVKLTWIEQGNAFNNSTIVHHVEGFKPGLHIKVLKSNSETVSEEAIGDDGVFEFTQNPQAGEIHYSMISEGTSPSDNQSNGSPPTPSSGSSLKTKTFACELFGDRVHCDPTLNDFNSYSVTGNFKEVTPLSSNSVFVKGEYGSAVKMDAKYRESVEISDSRSISAKQFSFSFFLRNSDTAEFYGHVVSNVNFAQTAGWFVSVQTDTSAKPFKQSLQFWVANTKGTLFAAPAVSLPQDQFVHIAGTFDGSTVKLYVDGQLKGEAQFKGSFNPDPGTPLRIGSASYSTSTNRWSGIIDELMIFDTPLTDEQIKDIPDALSSGKISDLVSGGDLVGYWTFNDNIKDASGNGRDGTTTTLLASMVFAPDGTMFFSEKNTGDIKIMRNDTILGEPFATLPDVYVNWEQGLLGLTLDSKFTENHYVYQYYTYSTGGEIFNKLVRFTDVNDKGTDMKVLLDRIPAVAGYHSGGALAFGPDDKLYITVGDATFHEFALDPNIEIGKVLRINRDGTIPSDNPIAGSPVFDKGHRNMYGIAFNDNGLGIITENGDTLYDEINVLKKDGNYGFPLLQPANVSPYKSDPTKSIMPIRTYYLTVAPTQEIYYSGNSLPQLKGKFLFGTFSGDVFALTIDKDTKRLVEEEKIRLHPSLFTPVIGIAQAPNGDLYYGSYSIFKLESLDLSTKVQDSFPVDVTVPKDIAVDNLSFDQDSKRLNIDIERQSSTGTGTNSSNAVLSVAIPKSLMDNIKSVTDDQGNSLNFKATSGGLTSSSGGYVNVTVSLADISGKSQVQISSVRVVPEFFSTGYLLIVFAAVSAIVIALSAVSRGRKQGDWTFFSRG